MKMKALAVLAACLFFSQVTQAKSPIRFLTINTIGFEYTGLWRGHTILDSAVASHELLHQFAINWAPVQYFHFLMGLGADRLSVDEYDSVSFDGNYRFSFSAGGYLNTPAFANKVLRLTGGMDLFYINSRDDNGRRYRGPVLDPFVGISVCPHPIFDIEGGVRWHFIKGKTYDSHKDSSGTFSNKKELRAYGILTLASSKAYAKFNFDISPATTSRDWQNGPADASLGFTIGALVKSPWPRKKEKVKNRYFPEYDEVKKKQDAMAKSIKDDTLVHKACRFNNNENPEN